jgi:hypothetical protein
MHRLIAIQQELKAPKNQKNNFGGYNYRSCEDILEAVKPLLKKQGLALIIYDDVVSKDGRFYIRAIATLYDETGKQVAQTAAFAREEETKKGMDASQITGSASSYARKYALNGLFAIDDTKDADATNTHGKADINPDTDIIEGLKACASYTELQRYYKANYEAVQDKKTFNQLATKLKAKYKENENG